MRFSAKAHHLPQRVATGVFILNSGIGKLRADEETAAQLHEFAAGAYPFVNKLKLGLYARTPGIRKQGSLFPTQQGIPLAKDAWLMGIGLGLVIDDLTDRPGPKD
jgi:hypothetical protein